MIVATRPDPTVRPPSRYQTGVLWCASGDFSCDLWRKIRIFHCVRMVFGDFVIMVLSHLAIRNTKYLLSHNFYVSRQQKNPGNLTVPGYLTFGHNVPCGTQYI